jgi:hypothetical protein
MRLILAAAATFTLAFAATAYAGGNHVGNFNDPGASNGAPVRDYPEDGATAQFGSHYRLPGGPEAVYRDCAYLTATGVPCLQGRPFVGEFRVRPGDRDSGGSGRNEAGLSNTSQVPLLPDYGDEMVFGGAFRGHPSALQRDNISGLSGVFAQWKGANGGPWLSWADNDSDALKLRSSANNINYWTSGLRYADLRQHWFRYVIHIKWGNPGWIKLYTALDGAPLTQRTFDNGQTTWTGRTTTSDEVDKIRPRIGMYYDDPVNTDHRLFSAGQNQAMCAASDMGCVNGFNSVAPPPPVASTPPPEPTPTPTPTATPTPTPTATPEPCG